MNIVVRFGKKSKTYPLISEPTPHILVNSKKEIHGWWNGYKPYGQRECTGERLLLNPYNGCSHNCFYCYSHALWGYFKLFKEKNIVTVVKDFDKVVAMQIKKLKIASCGYLSPITDPFQPVNKKYKLAEKLIKLFTEINLPIEFITKGEVSDEAIKYMKEQEHSFGQISILTLDEEKRKKLMLGGADTNTLIKNFRKLEDNGIYSVGRIDPIIPRINDNEKELDELVLELKNNGCRHIIGSCLDVPISMKDEIFNKIESITERKKINNIYNERIGNYLHANILYRKELFRKLRNICDKNKITFSLCMEFELTGKFYHGRPIVRGLNREFANVLNCEGIDVPIYRRIGFNFVPLKCKGNCLTCKLEKLACGNEKFREARALKLKDYINAI
ncbi:MAG: radical SAM protein [Candidatus Thermoplasmatota archaeon]